MKYAIDFHDMHNGCHGLFIFDSIEKAEKALKHLQEEKDIVDMEVEFIDYQENLNWREFEPIMENHHIWKNIKGRVSSYEEDVTIINYNKAVPLYQS